MKSLSLHLPEIIALIAFVATIACLTMVAL